MNINAEIDHCLGLSFYDLQDYAGHNYQLLYRHIEGKNPDKANTLLIGTIFTCIAANGKLTDKEYDFIAQFVGGYSRQEAFEVASEFFCDEARDTVRSLLEHLPYDMKEAYVKLCIAVLSVDKRFDGEEVAFLEDIL